MNDSLRKMVWFLVLWLSGVAAVTAVGFVIRTFLK
jgi:hypothetical protein